MELGVAVAAVGIVATINLLFTLAVVRRLREHTEAISSLSGEAGEVSLPGMPIQGRLALPPGERPGPFVASTMDRQEISEAVLSEGMLVGFFMPNCSPCADLLPKFVEAARRIEGDKSMVLAVIASDEGDAPAYMSALEGVATLILEPHEGPIGQAFEVGAYPAVFELGPDRRVRTSQIDVVLANLGVEQPEASPIVQASESNG